MHDIFRWLTPILDVDVSNQGTTYVARTLSVPPDVQVEAFGNIAYVSGDQTQIRPVGASDGTPSTSASPLYTYADKWRCLTDTSQQVETAAIAASSIVKMTTEGWRDFFNV